MKKSRSAAHWLSLALKLVVIVAAVAGTLMSAGAGRGTFMGGSSVFMYFTIQSNIAIALICVIGAYLRLSRRAISDGWYLVKFVGTVSITLTGVVFCFVLAPTLGPYAWSLPNVLTHVVSPLTAVVDFFVTGVDSRLAPRHCPYVTIPPILYAIYAGVGYVCHWEFALGVNYPYFFLNWGSSAGAFGFSSDFPFMGCMWWILLLLVFLLGVSRVYLLILSALKRRCGKV